MCTVCEASLRCVLMLLTAFYLVGLDIRLPQVWIEATGAAG